MSLKIGIVGLPNAGKSTLFNALLKKQQALAANYPFATIEPNVGIVPVPDKRLEKLAEVIASSDSGQTGMTKLPPIVPATVEFVDIAGLVAGASKGEGLGNKFLAHIREVDLICHVVRHFSDSDVVHVAGNTDPVRDKEIIETELILADLQTIKNQNEKIKMKNGNEKIKISAVEKLTVGLNSGLLAKDIELTDQEKGTISDLQLLTMKPVIIVKNVGEDQMMDPRLRGDDKGDSGDDKRSVGVDKGGSGDDKVENEISLVISAKIEAELCSLTPAEQQEYLKSLGWDTSGLDRLIQAAYKALGLISFLTAGVKEVRAWTIKKETKAPSAAGVIHTDFEKKFIKADVVTFEEFVAAPGWVVARSLGKVRSEGRDYTIKDGDVVEFKVGA